MTSRHATGRRHPDSAGALVQTGVTRLNRPGARLDTEVLLAHTLGATRTWVIAHPEHIVPPDSARQFDAALQRLAAGEPLPYLLGHWEFYGRDFIVTPAVLIPRPETELLIDTALAAAKDRPATLRLIDIGSGSGCIALTLAHALPQAAVFATDTSIEALAVAAKNARQHALYQRVQLHHGDLFAGLDGPFDLICANPPYIASDELQQLAVSKYEPRVALDGGPDGLDVIRRLLRKVRNQLRPGGLLLVEIGSGQRAKVRMLARRAFSGATIDIKPDLAGLDRLLVVQT